MQNDEVVVVNRKALMAAFLEMERQHSLEYFFMFNCMKQIEQTYFDMHRLMEGCHFSSAKSEVAKLLFPSRGEFSISDELLEEWDKEFETELSRIRELEKQRPPMMIINQHYYELASMPAPKICDEGGNQTSDDSGCP